MTKAILFDADGVVLKKYPEYFSERFAREYGAPVGELREFFKNQFKLCQTGKADLKVELAKRLPSWGWQKSVDEYLEYWFTTDASVDEQVLAKVAEFRQREVECYLATDQEQYRAQYLLDRLGLKAKFDGCFFSYDIGFCKSSPDFFAGVLHRLAGRFNPQEISYYDDDRQNVDTARSVGINAHFYASLNDLPGF